MDSTPLHLIATGCSTKMAIVTRKQKMSSSLERVPCPQLIADYHAGMGGVDPHDQLRYQSYSLQQCVAFKKYYQQLFLGFVDMTIVNRFIIHKLVMKKCGYMRRLHLELMSVSAATFEANLNAEDLVLVPLPVGKRRQHSCKVCFATADPNTKTFESSYYRPTCEDQCGG
ncbi:hypothetical protein PHPALM_30428 [Phytophthora palmivora]|uniref:PiggyBac transposable element-derived protein domain-containing protein n=1 Tax=Phytophthora palmivora TaxID=4796 RepID=A0A2P4X543_9STRA|nr:hypothetical protein PHPALM_30428 [Phytophthora palmivora]